MYNKGIQAIKINNVSCETGHARINNMPDNKLKAKRDILFKTFDLMNEGKFRQITRINYSELVKWQRIYELKIKMPRFVITGAFNQY